MDDDLTPEEMELLRKLHAQGALDELTGGAQRGLVPDQLAPDRGAITGPAGSDVRADASPSLPIGDARAQLDAMARSGPGEFRSDEDVASREALAAGAPAAETALATLQGASESLGGLPEALAYGPMRGLSDVVSGGVIDADETGDVVERRQADDAHPYAKFAGGLGASLALGAGAAATGVAKQGMQELVKRAPHLAGALMRHPALAGYLGNIAAAPVEESVRKRVEEGVGGIESNADPGMAALGSAVIGAPIAGARAIRGHVENLPGMKSVMAAGGGPTMFGIKEGPLPKAARLSYQLDESGASNRRSLEEWVTEDAAKDIADTVVGKQAASKAGREEVITGVGDKIYESAVNKMDSISKQIDAVYAKEGELASQRVPLGPVKEKLGLLLEELQPNNANLPFLRKPEIARLRIASRQLKNRADASVGELRAMLGGLDTLAGRMERTSGKKGAYRAMAGEVRDLLNSVPGAQANNEQVAKLYKQRDLINEALNLPADSRLGDALDPSTPKGRAKLNQAIMAAKDNPEARRVLSELADVAGDPGAVQRAIDPDPLPSQTASLVGLGPDARSMHPAQRTSAVRGQMTGADPAVREAISGQFPGQFYTPMGNMSGEDILRTIDAIRGREMLPGGRIGIRGSSGGNVSAVAPMEGLLDALYMMSYGASGPISKTPTMPTVRAAQQTLGRINEEEQ